MKYNFSHTLPLLLLLFVLCCLYCSCEDVEIDVRGNIYDNEIQYLQKDKTTGWRTFSDAAAKLFGLNLQHCSLDRIPLHKMTKELFEEEYFGRKPVVITNITDHWPALYKWNKAYFINKFGQRIVKVDETKIFENFGESQKQKKMSDYILKDLEDVTISHVLDLAHKKNPMPLKYSFYNFNDGEWDEIIKDSPTPDFFQFIDTSNGHVNQIAVGATGTGLSWHSHHDAWNSVVVGRKLWLIADPSGPAPASTGIFSTDDDPHCCSALNWHMEESRRREKYHDINSNVSDGVLQGINALNIEKKRQDIDTDYTQNLPGLSTWDWGSQDHIAQCVLHSGEAVYVPSRWAHATMNIGDTIARSQRAGMDLYWKPTLEKFSSSFITYDLDHVGQFGVQYLLKNNGSTKEYGTRQYRHINELLDEDALELICDKTQKYERRLTIFRYMTSIVKKVDRALKKMARNVKYEMPSKMKNQEKVMEHFQSSDMLLRKFKTNMGTCYIKDLYRSKQHRT